jgi:hypothetical protein
MLGEGMDTKTISRLTGLNLSEVEKLEKEA